MFFTRKKDIGSRSMLLLGIRSVSLTGKLGMHNPTLLLGSN